MLFSLKAQFKKRFFKKFKLAFSIRFNTNYKYWFNIKIMLINVLDKIKLIACIIKVYGESLHSEVM